MQTTSSSTTSAPACSISRTLRRRSPAPSAPSAPPGADVELRGRVALVTGAGRRLGRAIAAALAARGARLAVHHHASSHGAAALRDEIRAVGGEAECFAADLTDAMAARGLAPRVVAHFGALDVLVNSAAVMHRLRFEDTAPAQWDEIMNLNLRAVFFCTQG